MSEHLRVLITGAGGLLGRHAVAALRGHHSVHAVVRSMPQLAFDGATYQVLDLADSWSAEKLPKRIDAVVHLAQSSRFRDFPRHALDVFRVNVESTARLLDYARDAGAGRFIYASSGGVYGAGPVAFRENSPIGDPRRLGYYLGSKLCSEILAESYASWMRVVILRFFFMYGPGQNRSMLIPRLVDNVRNARPITLQGADGIRLNPVHVTDAVRIVEACLAPLGSRTINVAGPDTLSIRDIAEIIGARLKLVPSFESAEGDPSHIIGSNSLMTSMLGRSAVRFVDGVADVL